MLPSPIRGESDSRAPGATSTWLGVECVSGHHILRQGQTNSLRRPGCSCACPTLRDYGGAVVTPRRGNTEVTMTEPVQSHRDVALLALGDAGGSGTGSASDQIAIAQVHALLAIADASNASPWPHTQRRQATLSDARPADAHSTGRSRASARSAASGPRKGRLYGPGRTGAAQGVRAGWARTRRRSARTGTSGNQAPISCPASTVSSTACG